LTERRDIGSRLENWARWCTLATGRAQYASQTGAICERMRMAVEGSATSSERRAIDEDDAYRFERAMPKLDTKARMLLWWCYIKQAPPHLVCSRMGIPQKPATEFVKVFRDAQAAIELLVDGNNTGKNSK
jgi:DNA-directed RNA polymerase specialized sigma24 family protein